MRLVVDTNVFISAALKDQSWPVETHRFPTGAQQGLHRRASSVDFGVAPTNPTLQPAPVERYNGTFVQATTTANVINCGPTDTLVIGIISKAKENKLLGMGEVPTSQTADIIEMDISRRLRSLSRSGGVEMIGGASNPATGL